MPHLNSPSALLIVAGMMGPCLLVIFFILMQIRNQNKLLREQHRVQELEILHQKDLLHAVIVSQEEERNRIGMDLHDEVGTLLSSLRMTIEGFAGGGTGISDSVGGAAKSIIDRAIQRVRSISHNLSPFRGDAYRFADAVEDLCDTIRQSGQIDCSLEMPDEASLRLMPETTVLALYRVIHELINNTLRHAGARAIRLVLAIEDDRLTIDYRDDGRGTGGANNDGAEERKGGATAGGRGAGKRPEKKGMGLRNIESRLGMIGAEYVMGGGVAGGNEAAGGFRMLIKVPMGP